MSFYKRLSYSIGNEDWRTEQKALQITPQDTVICVTASGDRPLNLLSTECQQIVTIDANPYQNALLDLKKAALKALNYQDYLAFLGITATTDRLSLFKSVQNHLSKDSLTFWTKYKSKIKKGIIYEGATDKWMQRIAFFIRFFRGNKKVDQLFSFDQLEKQKEFIKNQWQGKRWKKAFHFCLHPYLTRFFIKDPGLYAYPDHSIHVGDHLYQVVNDALMRFSPKESIVLSLMLQGKIYEEAFPPYLTQEGTTKIKERLDRVTSKTMNVIDHLESVPEGTYDCFSFSDIASYMSREDFTRLTKAMYKAARPGARFCIRQFMSRHEFPEEIAEHCVIDESLGKNLANEDRCVIYHFTVGTISK